MMQIFTSFAKSTSGNDGREHERHQAESPRMLRHALLLPVDV